jgi:hypothetical protein
VNIQQPISSALNKRPVRIYSKKIADIVPDQVLNLSAFGDIIENPDKKGSDKTQDLTFNSIRGGNSDNKSHEKGNTRSGIDHVALKALQHTAQIKLLHWQTKSYAEHKALDEIFETLTDLTDNLVESIMGKYGRPHLGDNCSISLKDYQDGCAVDYINEIRKCYIEECKGHFNIEKDGEIINIIDEILASLDKTDYLLSLK